MHSHQSFIGVLAWSAFLALYACVPMQTLNIPDPIGPQPLGAPSKGPSEDGFLVVYTDTYVVEYGESGTYRPHGAYDLSDLRGKLLRHVKNHRSEGDENPEHLELANGHYMITGGGLGQQLLLARRLCEAGRGEGEGRTWSNHLRLLGSLLGASEGGASESVGKGAGRHTARLACSRPHRLRD